MRTRVHKNLRRAAWLVLCAVLLCVAASRVLAVRAEKAAPEGCSLEEPKPKGNVCFPLNTAEWRVSDSYGWRADPLTGEDTFHRGTDLACAEGTPVVAARSGIVTAAHRSTSYGNYVLLCHPGGQETVYAHLQYVFVRAGEVVQAGQVLGTAGQTGRATGAHLHFELLVQGVRCDPSALLGLP